MKKYKFDLENEKDLDVYLSLIRNDTVTKVVRRLSEDIFRANSLGEAKTIFAAAIAGLNSSTANHLQSVAKQIGKPKAKIVGMDVLNKTIEYKEK